MVQVAIMAAVESRRIELARRLRADPSLEVVGVASTFAFLRSWIDEGVVDGVIVDAGSEAEAGRRRDWLLELLDVTPVVLLSAASDTWTFNQFMNAERGAILGSDASVEQIVNGVRAACAGLLVFDAALVPRPDPGDEILTELTPREVEVLQLLAEGLVNRDIADRLKISEHTIKFHIGSILGKLQASSRTEAVTRGLRSGLIEL